MSTSIRDLQEALKNDLIIPSFQPIAGIRTGVIEGFEVLARWQHPDLGPVLPSNFIALAEEHDLIEALMRQVLRKAFLVVSDLPAALFLAINVSPLQLRDLTLPGQIREAAETAGFPLDRVVVEITESALLDNLDRARTIAVDLKAMGCRLSLDDFGTGYSSLAHLQALPFDKLKIDRSFVASMTKTRESRKIVAAIIGLGHSLGLKTVAEGVETEEQADMLLWLGCEFGQGWLYGRPVPAEAISSFFATAPRAVPPALAAPGEDWAVSSLEALPTHRLAQLQAIYDGAPVGLCFLDEQLRYVSMNQRLAEMNGGTVAAHLGRSMKEMLPDFFPRVEPMLRRALAGEAISGFELQRPGAHPGDPEMTLVLSYQPAWDEADEVIGVSVAAVDVTELRRSQEILKQTQEEQREHERRRHMEELNEQIPWITDAEGNSLYSSSSWVRITGLSTAKARNLGWLEALHPDDLEPTMKLMKDALRSGKALDIQYRVMDVNEEWVWMRSRGTPRFGGQGEITRWYGTVERLGLSQPMELAQAV